MIVSTHSILEKFSLDELYDEINRRQDALGDDIYSAPWKTFWLLRKNVKPQLRGNEVEKWCRNYFGWTQPTSSHCGDAISPMGEYIEIKSSVLRTKNGYPRFVWRNIRLEDRVDWYYLVGVSPNNVVHSFVVPPDVISELASANGEISVNLNSVRWIELCKYMTGKGLKPVASKRLTEKLIAA